MSQLKTGTCGHVISVWDPHTGCACCRPCEMPDKREVDPTSSHPPRGGVPEKEFPCPHRGDRGSGGTPAHSISPRSNEAWVRRQAHRRRSRSPTGRTGRGRSSSSENEGPDGVSPEREITSDLLATGLPASLLPRWKLPARSGVYNPPPSP